MTAMSTEHLFQHYRRQAAPVPRDAMNSLQGMSVVRRTIDGKYLAGEVTKAGSRQIGRFQVRYYDSGDFDWISFLAIDSGEAFLCYSRGDATAILGCLHRAAADDKTAA